MSLRRSVSGLSEPQQQRSRDSFAKVRAAARDLLRERGTAQFSLAEVSARADVSIGAIYGRVAGKAELLRIVQSEEFDRLDRETEERIGEAGAEAADFAAGTAQIVSAYAEILRSNRDVLSPFFLLGVDDGAILARGRQSGDAGQAVFVRALRGCAERHGVELSARTAEWAFEIFYSLCVRYLGLGVAATATPDGAYGWDELLERLAHTVYLVTAPA